MRVMRVRLTQLSVPLDYDDELVRRRAAGRLGIHLEDILTCRLTRRAIDARRLRGRVQFILNLELDIADSAAGAIDPAVERVEAEVAAPALTAGALAHRPVVVGAGPAGLLAAWRLARAGAAPILIERGAPVADRRRSVKAFWADGTLDPDDGPLFGEGGAGLFSDGKLTTRSKQRGHLRSVLEVLVACGAPESILIDAEPHLGSDRLGGIVERLREEIIAFGGEVRFRSRHEGMDVDAGRLVGITVNGQRMPTDHCILATGHSARDVYHMLHAAGVALAAKPFAVGVRVEVPQWQIDRSQFGPAAGHPRLGSASFRLTRREQADLRACYTFCMCPGGPVIACASSPGELTTNGMSFSARGGLQGNAAFLVPVAPADFGGETDPLAGIDWQRGIEARAFQAGGGDYSLPAENLTDFLAARPPTPLRAERSCPRAIAADLHSVLPPFVSHTLRHAVPHMLRQLADVSPADGVVYAAETRSSSPVRIVRGEDYQSVNVRGLFPAGEGAGYAGGIITSAIDGLRAAEALLAESQ
jgi:uncharacterized FAD-dependent dehydrogenase